MDDPRGRAKSICLTETPLEDTLKTEQIVLITKILAELDLAFSVGKSVEGRKRWDLVPLADPSTEHEQPVPVSILLQEPWLHVFSLFTLKKEPTAGQLRDLLIASTDIPGAKIGLVKEPGFPLALWAGQQVAVGQVNDAEIVKVLIGSVTIAMRQARQILQGVQSGANQR